MAEPTAAVAARIGPPNLNIYADYQSSGPSRRLPDPNVQVTITPPPPPPRSLYPDYSAEDAAAAPWKYTGYRVFSRWMAADQEFFIVRRFGALNTRVILALQDEITQLERVLDGIDMQYSRKAEDPRTNNGSFRFDPSDQRRELIHDILPGKLLKYNKLINEYSKLVTRAAVDPEDVSKVKRWFDSVHPGAIEKDEQDFINHNDDLIPVLPKVKSRFRNFLESTLLRPSIIRRYFDRTPDDIETIDDDMTIWYSDKKVERFFSIVVAVGGLSMLIGPLWILEYVSGSAMQLGVITSFISLFFFLVTVATTAKIFEAMAAAAAYAAVLLVFVQMGRS